MSTPTLAAVYAALPQQPRELRGSGRLSPRELFVMRLIFSGLEHALIGELIARSPNTVEAHVEHVRHKLGARTATHMLALLLHRGELTLDDLAVAEQTRRQHGN